MDERTDGRTERPTEGQTDGQMDGEMDGRSDPLIEKHLEISTQDFNEIAKLKSFASTGS